MFGPDDLRHRRRALGLTQAELARLLGVAANTVARWERGDKRIGHPERIWIALQQLRQSQLEVRPKASPSRSNNLPAELSSFVGRESEVGEVRRLLEANRLVVLTGAGGVGKTRLALRVAEVVQSDHQDGVWLVELASVVNPDLLPAAVAAVLELREQPGQPLPDAIRRSLESRHTLLVLDNCEHLLNACEQFVSDLLSGTHTLKILATSREPLAVMRGVAWRVPSLSLPAPQAYPALLHRPEPLDSEAIRLFVERARVWHAFSLDETNAEAVAQICVRLGGIPLALELAAAWTNVLTPQQMLARLDYPLWLIARRKAKAPPRHQTLRAAIDWSYALLGSAEQDLFERLGAFAGSWTLEAAESVCSGEGIDRHEVLGIIARLVDTSLLTVDVDGSATRYRMLEPIRQYARERLEHSRAQPMVRRSAVAYFLNLAERLAPDLYAGRDGGRAEPLAILDREHDNLRSALRSLIQGGEVGPGLRLANAIGPFWLSRGYLAEGRAWMAELLPLASGNASESEFCSAYIAGLGLAARLASAQGDYQAALVVLDERRGLSEAANEQHSVIDTHILLGTVAESTGDYTNAAGCYERALRLARQLADGRTLLNALEYYGLLTQRRGQLSLACSIFEEAVALARRQSHPSTPGRPLAALGYALLEMGDLDRAETVFGDRLAIWRRLRNARNCAISQSSLGTLALGRGDVVRARGCYLDTFQRYLGCGELEAIPYFLTCFALLARHTGNGDAAARLGGAADGLRQRVGAVSLPATRAWTERTLDPIRASGSALAWTAGGSLSLEQAISEAFALVSSSSERAEHSSLTRREEQVAALIARGLSNRAIAAELVVSERTIDAHVEHIRAKLGLRSRTHVAAWAGSQGLFDSVRD